LRVKWARQKFNEKKVIHAFIFRQEDGVLIGAITLSHLRRGAAQSGSIGYWLGEEFIKKGYMTEAVKAVIFQAFKNFGLSRIEAATLPENQASRILLENLGFKYEGVAQSYLQIAGRWRNHIMYSLLRDDRRGKK
jgi:ribosomal-protein-alanine N-acetyltransferase